MEIILPCPFCGATQYDDDDGLVDGMSRNGSTIWVRCLRCGAGGPSVEYVVDENSVITSWPGAVRLWNARKGIN